MLVSLKDINSTKKHLKIEIPAETIESEIKKVLNDYRKRVRIPGFRVGKAPMNWIEKKFGKNAEAEALEKLILEFYDKAIKEADIKPVTAFKIVESNFKRNEPLSMTLAVEVIPKVENLNYEGITVKEISVDATDEEVDSILQILAEEKATYESIDDVAAFGDLITVDYTVKEEGISSKDVVIKIGSGPYPPEFFDAIVGKKKDEELTIEASFPEDLQTPFAGKRPTFELKIKDIKRRYIPTIDDEFAKDMGLDDLSSLKSKIKENIIISKNFEASRIKIKEILDKLVESHNFDVPESLLNAEIDMMINEMKSLNKIDKSEEKIKEEIIPYAIKKIKASILLELIGEKEGLTVSEEEVRERILEIAQKYNVSFKTVLEYYITRDGSLEGIKKSLFEKKVLKFLLDKAKVEK